MARYQVILTYDGAGFRGFQKQANARTVQGVIEEALHRLDWKGSSLLAAGRTDTGVHASGQVIAFDLEWRHSSLDLLRALNALLPEDVAASQVALVEADFHPRYHAAVRWYRYHLFCHPVRQPYQERYAWRVWPEVDQERMKAAASLLAGRYDFAAFGSPMRPGGSTVRTITHASWNSAPGLLGQPVLVFDVAADAFLYHMVRRLVFFQVEIGKGLAELEEVQLYLQGHKPTPVQGLAPPNGLFLTRVEYPTAASGEDNLEIWFE
jgi:tRNA pseudouridine38-40 synthase